MDSGSEEKPLWGSFLRGAFFAAGGLAFTGIVYVVGRAIAGSDDRTPELDDDELDAECIRRELEARGEAV